MNENNGMNQGNENDYRSSANNSLSRDMGAIVAASLAAAKMVPGNPIGRVITGGATFGALSTVYTAHRIMNNPEGARQVLDMVRQIQDGRGPTGSNFSSVPVPT